MEENLLQEINKDKFYEITEFLKRDLPVSLLVINVLKSYIREDKSNETDLKVLCPKGDIRFGVVVVLSYFNKCGFKFIFIHSNVDQTSDLQQALITKRTLNWSDGFIEGLYDKLLPTLEQVFKTRNIPYAVEEEYCCLFLPGKSNDLSFIEVVVPEDLIIRPLTEEDAKLINETWAYYSATSYDYIRHSISFHGGLGLVSRHDNRLVSWAVGVHNTIGMAHTLSKHRHKGYAQIVIKALARKFIAENIQPVCLIKKDNIPSIKLFNKLGFEDAGLFYYITWDKKYNF